MPVALFNQLDHGSEDDVSYRHNREVFERIKLIHRILQDVSQRDPSITLFGKKHDLPLIITPTGITSWISYRGEVSLARAAAKANIPFTLTSTTATPMETVLEEGGGTQWYQAIMWRDLESSLRGVERARDAGFEALFLTVDSTIPYNRPWDKRQDIKFPLERVKLGHLFEGVRHPHWALGTPARYLLKERQLPGMTNTDVPEGMTAAERRAWFVKEDSLDWTFFQRVRDLWPRTLIIKGILHPDDAVQAISAGADAIVVSNHGGATNDSAPSPLEMLPSIVAAVAGRVPVLVDSGFRRGSDVLKAIALGADAVMIGRATLYGLAAAGEAGASHALSILRDEIRRTMGALGLSDLASIGRDHLLLPGDLDHLSRVAVPWKGTIAPELDAELR
nr:MULTISPECIES: alpha-hydroxy acid oxidase [unclassified Cryobacterium]